MKKGGLCMVEAWPGLENFKFFTETLSYNQAFSGVLEALNTKLFIICRNNDFLPGLKGVECLF